MPQFSFERKHIYSVDHLVSRNETDHLAQWKYEYYSKCMASLARRTHRVAVVERGPLQGRQQEWNISRKELQELVCTCTPLTHECVSHRSACAC